MGKKSRRRRGGQRSGQESASPQEELPASPPDELSVSSLEVQKKEYSVLTREILDEEEYASLEALPEEEYASLREEGDDLIDRFSRATTRFPNDPWHPERVECLYLYQRLARVLFSKWEGGFITESDRTFLGKLRRVNEPPQPAFFKATALLLFSIICQSDGWYRYQAVVDYTDRAIALCDSASMEEKERILDLPEPHGHVKVGDYLLRLRYFCGYPERLCREAWCQEINPYNTDGDSSKPVFEFPGIQCDGCREHRRDLDLSTLEVCTSCKLVYYCSKQCQRKAWHDGHKNMCRKSGEFKFGDIAYILDPVDQFVSDTRTGNTVVFGNFTVGQRVRIIGPIAGDTSKLIVQDLQWIIENLFGVVAVEDLQRCEPPKWYLTGNYREAVGARIARIRQFELSDSNNNNNNNNNAEIQQIN